MPAPFFFSYAHNDASGDDYLDQFYKELSKRVRYLTGLKDDGFRDDPGLRAGEEWSPKLADELRVTPVMVCMYSPSYFESKVCSQELQVLLDRRLQYLQVASGKRPANIIPVLWQPAEIPRTLPVFQYEKPCSQDLAEEGVWNLLDNDHRPEFNKIAQAVAVRVKEASKVQLPPLGFTPVLNGVESAFAPPPLPPTEFDAPGAAIGMQCATFVYPDSPAWKAWPFAPNANPMLYISASVAKGRDLRSHQLTFNPEQSGFFNRLASARKSNNLVVLLVEGASLSNGSLAARLRELDKEKPDTVGILIAWAAGSRTPKLAQLVKDTFPNLSSRQPPLFYADIDDHEKFANAIGESLDALHNALLRNLSGIQALSVPTAYTMLPTPSGPGVRNAA